MPDRSRDQAPLAVPSSARALAVAVRAAGGTLWLVGGWVRDALLGRLNKDLDLEAHGLDAEALERALRRVGSVHRVGRSFDVYKVRFGGEDLDVSLPRRSPRAAPGLDLDLAEAARRRDLTINAMAVDPLSGRVEDPWGGLQDLERRVLRAVDEELFLDDPLRALRVVQFAARLGFAVDPALERVCRGADLRGVATERVSLELEKLLVGAPRPGDGFAMARDWGLLAQVLPELEVGPALCLALDRAASRRLEMGDPPRPLALMLATMLHCSDSDQTEAVLDRLHWASQRGWPLRDRVVTAVIRWRELVEPATDAALRRLAESSALSLIAETAWAATGSPAALDARARAEATGVGEAPLLPLLFGRDLRSLGLRPGPEMGRLLSRVREAQIQGIVTSPAEATALVSRWLSEQSPPAVVD